MSDLTTTLAAIRAQSPCREGWTKLLKHVGDLPEDAPLPLLTVLESNGVADALWVAGQVIGGPASEALAPFLRECALRACDHAERALPIFEAARPGDRRPREAIAVARARIAGAMSAGDARIAAAYAYAARAAVAAAASAAGDDAAYSDAYAYAARAVAAAACKAEREWQAARLREYLTGAAKKEVA